MRLPYIYNNNYKSNFRLLIERGSMMKKFAVSAFILSALISLPLGSVSHANNLTISNVALGARNPTNQTIDSLMHLELPAGVDVSVKM